MVPEENKSNVTMAGKSVEKVVWRDDFAKEKHLKQGDSGPQVQREWGLFHHRTEAGTWISHYDDNSRAEPEILALHNL